MEYNLIGKILGSRYEITEEIGTGGMATVYKARCSLLNRYVAVKVLKSSLRNDEEVVKRFITESRAAASLSHHNIVSVYDVGKTEDGLNYIVMELVEGETLKEYIRRKYRLEKKEACEFAYQIASALTCAHEHGIIHRDIKPHNILVTKDRELKVADFGIARTTNQDTMLAKEGNDVFGSAHYISPEQARGGYIDASSDVYSLGVVLYEMLTGKVPFDGENPVTVAIKKLEEEPEDIRKVLPGIPEGLASVVMRSIAKEQYIRYTNAADFAYDLREIIDSDFAGRIKYKPTQKKNPKKKIQFKINTKNTIISAVLVAVILGLISFFSLWGGKSQYEVPDLMDKTLEEAISIAKQAGFEIVEENIKYVTSDEYEPGRVMKQNPGANGYVKKRGEIEIEVSQGLGEGNIEIPDVVGMDYTKAATMLRSFNLSYEKVEENSDKPHNEVIDQSPEAGIKVSEDYTVTLKVSTGIEPSPTPVLDLQVPSLVGANISDVELILNSLKLKKGSVTESPSDLPKGTVISQSPDAGTPIIEGAEVTLVVSSGKVEPTPDVKKKTLTITLPQTESGRVRVKLIANGTTIYEKEHSSSEGAINIPVAAKKTATVEVYFDDVLVSTKVLEF